MTDSDRILTRLLELHPKRIDLSLGRIHRLLAALGHPEKQLPPVIHVAGTNGKGSVVAMLRAGLRGSGASAHIYTSPHLVKFHERIEVANQVISEASLRRLLTRCEIVNQDAPISFFEITTAAALLAFAETPADSCVLEVGLGGRLDATNVVAHPAVSCITRIGRDHHEFLGRTLPQIAAEKAGIMKAETPCVVGPQRPTVLRMLRKTAEATGTPLFCYGRDWDCKKSDKGIEYRDAQGQLALPSPGLFGDHQIENAGVAVAALRQFGTGDVIAAVCVADWPARLQRLHSGPLVSALPEQTEIWLDGGHNEDAAKVLSAAMKKRNIENPRSLYLLCGMLAVKNHAAFMKPFVELDAEILTVNLPPSHQGISASLLAQKAKQAGLRATAYNSLDDAYKNLVARTGNHRILICGSFYFAGEILKHHK